MDEVQITINSITGASPYDIYICDSQYTTCIYIATIASAPYSFIVPAPLNTLTSFGIKAIDTSGCSITDIISGSTTCGPTSTPGPSPTPTPTPGPTATPTPTPTVTPVPQIFNAILTAMEFIDYVNNTNSYTVRAGPVIIAAAQVSVTGTLFAKFVARDSTSGHTDNVMDRNVFTLNAGDNQSIGDEIVITTRLGWYDQVVLQQSLTNLPGSWVDYVTYQFPAHVSGETQNGFYLNNGSTAVSSTQTLNANLKLNPGWVANLQSWVLSSITANIQSYIITVGTLVTPFSGGTISPTVMTNVNQTFGGTLTAAPGSFVSGSTLQIGVYFVIQYVDDHNTLQTLDVGGQFGAQIFPAQGTPFYVMDAKIIAT